MTRFQHTIMILATLTHMACYACGNPRADNASENTTARISTKHMPAATFVFVDHVGPYWNLSRTIEALTAYMKQHQQAGSIVIRYEGHPQSKQFLRYIRVGFQAQDDFETQPPYQLVQDEASLVVTTTMTAGLLNPVRCYAQLRDWARLHELEIIGPFMEIHASPQATDTSDAAIVEVQLGVRDKSEQPNVLYTPATKHYEKAYEPTEALKNLTTMPAIRHKGIADIAIDQADTMPRPTTPLDLPTKKTSQTDSARQYEVADTYDSPTKSTEPPQPKSKANKSPRLREGSTSFEPVADLLFSTFAEGEHDNHEQLAKLVLRIQAIATGAEQRYPGQAAQLKQLSELMTLKLAQYTNQSLPLKPDNQHGQIDKTNARQDPQLIRATKQLETVMGRMGYRTMLPKQALLRVLTIIRQAVEESAHGQTPTSQAP